MKDINKQHQNILCNNDGAVLILALLVSFVLILMGGAAINRSINDLRDSGVYREGNQVFNLADGGAALMMDITGALIEDVTSANVQTAQYEILKPFLEADLGEFTDLISKPGCKNGICIDLASDFNYANDIINDIGADTKDITLKMQEFPVDIVADIDFVGSNCGGAIGCNVISGGRGSGISGFIPINYNIAVSAESRTTDRRREVAIGYVCKLLNGKCL